MAITSYSDLKQSIINHLEHDDLAAHVDEFIGLAEDRHRRDIRIREQIKKDTPTVDSRTLAIPSDLLEVFMFRLMSDPVQQLDHVNFSELNRRREKWEHWGRKKIPTAYTMHAEFEFDVEPDQDYDGELYYYAEIARLSDDNASNVLLARSADAYLYGALVATAPWLMDDERVATWERFYQQAVSGLADTTRYSSPIVSRLHTPGP